MTLDHIGSRLRSWILELGMRSETLWNPKMVWVDYEAFRVYVRFYTETNEYRIRVDSLSESAIALRCIAVSRKRRAGEGWHRQNDIIEGPFSKDTWNKMLMEMLCYEILDKPACTVQESIEHDRAKVKEVECVSH